MTSEEAYWEFKREFIFRKARLQTSLSAITGTLKQKKEKETAYVEDFALAIWNKQKLLLKTCRKSDLKVSILTIFPIKGETNRKLLQDWSVCIYPDTSKTLKVALILETYMLGGVE